MKNVDFNPVPYLNRVDLRITVLCLVKSQKNQIDYYFNTKEPKHVCQRKGEAIRRGEEGGGRREGQKGGGAEGGGKSRATMELGCSGHCWTCRHVERHQVRSNKFGIQ